MALLWKGQVEKLSPEPQEKLLVLHQVNADDDADHDVDNAAAYAGEKRI